MNIAVVIALLYILAVGLARCLAFAARRIRRSHPVAVGVFLLGSVLAALHADKPTPVPSALLRWDRGLADNGSIATNDTVSIRGTYDPLMANDALHVDYRDRTITDSPDGWARAYDGAVGDLADGFTVTIPDATNMIVWIWSEYIEPAPTHTNGEYRIIYVGRIDGGAAESPRYVTPRTPIVASSEIIPVEYLESTGTQYIHLPAAYKMWDIGLKPKDIAKPAYSRFYAGCMNRGSRAAACYATSDSALEFQNYGRAVLTVPCDFYTWHDISVRSSTVTVDGAVFTFSIGTTAYGSYIFGCDYNGVFGVKCQISYYRAYDGNGNVVLDLIPVRFTNENNQSEGAMFDRANPTVGLNPDGSPRTDGLYRNRGIGSFVCGPDVRNGSAILSPPSLPPPAQSLFSTLATENLTE